MSGGGPPERAPGRGQRGRAAETLARLELFEVTVEKLVTGGDGLARYQGIPIFVPRAVPGDRLRVRLAQRRPDYGRAEIAEVLEAGPGRRRAPCAHFASCGGCDLQQIDDELQPRLKAAAVEETLRRLGRLEMPEPELVTGEAWGYRLRAQLHAEKSPSGGARVGYYARGSRDLVPVDRCPVLVPELEEELPRLAAALPAAPPRRLDLAAGQGGRWTVAPVIGGLPRGAVELEVGEHTFRYDARTFFQGHRELLPKLVECAVGPWRGNVAWDLYAGVGLFTLALARRYARVAAVESDPAAARYARINARRNGLEEIEVLALRAEAAVKRLPEACDRLLVDPPRSGLGRAVLDGLLAARPRRLTYVSCDPPTLARDLRRLLGPYEIDGWTLFDLFPQTGHMEVVVQLAAA